MVIIIIMLFGYSMACLDTVLDTEWDNITFRDLSLGDIGLRGMDETMPEMSFSVCWTLFVGHRQWQTQERAV